MNAFCFKSALCAAILGLGLAAVLAAGRIRSDELDFNKPLSAEEQRLLPGVLLGKRIFEDTSLSEPPGLACTSCHDPATAYRGSNHSSIPAVPAGSRPGMFGSRKTPSIAYEAYSPPFSFARRLNDVTGEPEIVPVGGQFWDGRAGDLQEQVAGPLLDPREMNNASLDAVVERIRKGPYAELVRNVYGPQAFDQPGLFAKLAASIASYEESPRFKLFSSKFDDWLEGRTLLTDQEWRGYQLFVDKQKGNCLSCHDGGGSDEGGKTGPTDPANLSRNPRNWLFTDFTYDTLGVPRNRALPDNADPAHYDLGLCARANLQDLAPKGFDVSKLCGAFKVPSLRNVAVSGPYMHNGAFSSLRDAVAFYFTRDTDPGHWYRADMEGGIDKYDDLPAQYKSNVNTGQAPYDRHMGEPPRASDDEIDAIVAFLRTLTDKQFLTGAGSLTDAKK